LALLAGGGYYYYTQHYQKSAPAPTPTEQPGGRLDGKAFIQPQRTEPAPKPQPEPLPLPAVPPDTTGGSEISATTTAPPAQTAPAAEGPKTIFNIEPFLARARTTMAAKSEGPIKTRRAKLATSIDTFEREVSRAARKEGAPAVEATAKAVKLIRENG